MTHPYSCHNLGKITEDGEELNRSFKNIPIVSSQNIPTTLSGQFDGGGCRSRRYTRAKYVERLAIEKYNKNGKGITFNDLLSYRLALHKEQAQTTLKHCLKSKDLFTISSHKPQQYYPTALKAEILKHRMSRNAPVGVTEVGYSKAHLFCNKSSNNNCVENSIATQSLEGYVLPLLPSAPLYIHKIHSRLKISPECYKELNLPISKGNNGKQHVVIIGKVRVSYHFYANGTVMVFTESSNSPFRLEDETDRSRLIAFFGQVKDRLVTFLADIHERIVPDILEWELTQCDINKDIRVGEGLQYTGIKVQAKHFDHLFRAYIKSIGKDTVCRVEESLNLRKKPAIQTISEILSNPNVKSQQSSSDDDDRTTITEIHDMVKSLVDLHRRDSFIAGQKVVQQGGS
jgi:hypothetical protein